MISHENSDSRWDLLVAKRQWLQLERTGEVAEPAEAEPSPSEPAADGDLGDPVVEDLTFLASIVFAFGIAC